MKALAIRDDLLQVRSFGVAFYLLRDNDNLYLIDAGFVAGRRHLRSALRRTGWDGLPVRGILLTHGHLDHILNVAEIAEESGAWVAAPKSDLAHYRGRPSYRGPAKFIGMLEAVGRIVLGYREFTPTRFLETDDFLDIWHGLRVFPLPGRTAGHSGYLCERLGLLFCGDLFASFGAFSHFPPRILNSDTEESRRSAARVAELDLKGVLPGHADRSTPEEHWEKFRQMVSSRVGRR